MKEKNPCFEMFISRQIWNSLVSVRFSRIKLQIDFYAHLRL